MGTLLLAATVAAVIPLAAAEVAPVSEASAGINQRVERRWKEKGVTPAALCDDRTFARRVYLDLAGRIPTPAEMDAFSADTSAGKRQALVDQLLAGPEYARHMRDVFDVVLMGRKPGGERRRRGQDATAGIRGEWLGYLERSFAENRPWDRLVSDVLLARPASAQDRGAVWFLYARQDKYQDIAEAVSPAVFGLQVQCAQCHDHPLAHEVKQAHYWGLVAFFNRGKNRTTKGGPRIAESAIGGFADYPLLTGGSQASSLSFLGAETIEEKRPAAGEKEQDSPELYRPGSDNAAEEPPVPKFSRRAQFVEQVVRKSPLVARAAVNRFWALLIGRGIVHPVDKMDSTHPPADPELLDWLATDFQKSGYDVRRLVRAVVLSRPYQLDSHPVPGVQPDLFAYGIEKPLTAESYYRSLQVAVTGRPDTETPGLKEALAEVFPDVLAEENISTLRQTMFLTNNPTFQKLAQPEAGTTASRLAAITDPAARVREAYRVAYAREPEPGELAPAVAYLKSRADRAPQATSQLWWALLAGAEFRFNH